MNTLLLLLLPVLVSSNLLLRHTYYSLLCPIEYYGPPRKVQLAIFPITCESRLANLQEWTWGLWLELEDGSWKTREDDVVSICRYYYYAACALGHTACDLSNDPSMNLDCDHDQILSTSAIAANIVRELRRGGCSDVIERIDNNRVL
jgi:hypothetical protein